MAGNIIDFPRGPGDDAGYIDKEAIERACRLLELEVRAIVVGSNDVFDMTDPLAHELNAYLIAIRRAVAAIEEGD